MSAALLLDTCAAIWISQRGMVEAETVDLINLTVAESAVYVSPITAWEVGNLVSRGRLILNLDAKAWFSELLAVGFEPAPLTPEILIDSSFLPQSPLRDPADRIVAATARALNCALLTRDRKLLDYAQAGWIKAIRC